MAQHDSKTPLESRDLWSTPQWLFDWLNDQYNFSIDLCASKENTKCGLFIDEEMDGLKTSWMSNSIELNIDTTGFFNPPYSDVKRWVNQATSEKVYGFTSVAVIPSPNGELYYKEVFKHASKITFIHGRVAFIASCDYEKVSKKGEVTKVKKGDAIGGNTRGTCVVEFKPCILGSQTLQIEHVNRDDIMEVYDYS